MTESRRYLPGEQPRAHWMRLDSAHILKRFFFCERALVRAMGAWLPLLAPLAVKTELPLFLWQSAQTADALRTRVFELRYPSRLLDLDDDALVVAPFEALVHAPAPVAFLHALGLHLLPALGTAYQRYLERADPIADGPTQRFLRLALAEKAEQARVVQSWLDSTVPLSADEARWLGALGAGLERLGNLTLAKHEGYGGHLEPLPASRPYQIPDSPARDAAFWRCRFYWPDVVDPDYPYGEGAQLQLRSAISHLNEAWAVETAGIALHAFADILPWEWIVDAARWAYDEARHCRMGYERLRAWGFRPAELPLGDYIYASAAGQDPIYRLGMLFFFETKNIKHKPSRARLFAGYGDAVSQHDMEFDWADETIHASYGKRWLQAILVARGESPDAYEAIRERCGALVAAYVQTATEAERQAIRAQAERLLAHAAQP